MVLVPPSTVRELTDRLLDGKLDTYLAERREKGDSYNEIAFTLRTDHGVSVTGETVRAWFLAAAETEPAA